MFRSIALTCLIAVLASTQTAPKPAPPKTESKAALAARRAGVDALFATVKARRDKLLAMESHPDTYDDGAAYQISSRLEEDLRSLVGAMSPDQTARLIALVPPSTSTPDSPWHEARNKFVYRLYAASSEHVDKKLVLQLMLSELDRPEGSYGRYWAVKFVAHSSQSAALAWLHRIVADPGAPGMDRWEAQQALVRRLGARALPEIRAGRDGSWRYAPAWPARNASLDDPPIDAYRAKRALLPPRLGKDSAGRTWCIFASDALGRDIHLWIARKDGDRWTDFAFTGAVDPIPDDWMKRFVENPAIRRDSDHDGLPDLVERRIGTDPNKADTDGDGVIDGEDSNPLAAPRVLSETEQVLAAAFVANCRLERSWMYSIVVMPTGIAPMEFQGLSVIHRPMSIEEASAIPFKPEERDWPVFITFSRPREGFDGKPLPPSTNSGDSVVLFNADHTQARVSINQQRTTMGASGRTYHFRKIGGEWFPDEIYGGWIS